MFDLGSYFHFIYFSYAAISRFKKLDLIFCFVDINGKTVTKMTSTLSYDARAISESAAADFLETLQILLHNPANLLLGLPPKKQRSVAH